MFKTICINCLVLGPLPFGELMSTRYVCFFQIPHASGCTRISNPPSTTLSIHRLSYSIPIDLTRVIILAKANRQTNFRKFHLEAKVPAQPFATRVQRQLDEEVHSSVITIAYSHTFWGFFFFQLRINLSWSTHHHPLPKLPHIWPVSSWPWWAWVRYFIMLHFGKYNELFVLLM